MKKLRRTLAGTGAMLGLTFALGAAPASAATIYDYFYSNQFTDGTGSTAGIFSSTVDRLAFDKQNEQLLVLDIGTGGGVLSKFTAAAAPSPFTGLGGASSITLGALGTDGDVTVDNTGGGTQGNIYVVSITQGKLFGFAPSGVPLSGFPKEGLANPCGVAVDPAGTVWVKERFEGEFQKFTPTGEAAGTIPARENACHIAIDNSGHIYSAQFNNLVRKYDAAGTFEYELNATSSQSLAVDPSDNSVFVVENQNSVKQYNELGGLVTTFGTADPGHFSYLGLQQARGVAVNPVSHTVYVSNRRNYAGKRRVELFTRSAPITVPTVVSEAPEFTPSSATLHGTVNADGIDTTDCHFDWGTSKSYGKTSPCLAAGVPTNVFTGASGDHAVTADLAGLEKGTTYHFRISSKNANGRVSAGGNLTFQASGKPVISGEGPSQLNTDGARLNATVDPNGATTKYRIEWGETAAYGNTVPVPDGSISTPLTPEAVSTVLTGLAADTTYHFRIVATNQAGTTEGPDRTFKTYALPPSADLCPNALVRKQTSSYQLLDCRAYELVSASDQGGYDVESDLLPGQTALTAYPRAHDRLLYAMHFGAIPGAGSPTNFGHEPYVAIRGADGWTTEYVGLPADGMPSDDPFGSPLLEADQGLGLFAFGGSHICAPCFVDSSTNIPLRLADGSLVKGMSGSLNPSADPSGHVAKRFSDDGDHFIFGASEKFEEDGNEGSVSIYDRDLSNGTTQVVSTLPDGTTMSGEVGELGVSADGSRVVVATKISSDAAGNGYWHPYLHIGTDAHSVDLAPGTTTGVLYAGMSTDGSAVYFTTKDKLSSDTDESADLFRATVGAGGGPAVITRLSTGAPPPVGDADTCDPVPNADGNNWNAVGLASVNDCGVVVIAGAAGLATGDGTIYFLSPESLDGSGTLNQPNLFVVRPGAEPKLVATLEPDNSVVRNAVKDNEVHRYGDFQVAPNGTYAAFNTTLPLTGFNNLGHMAIYHYDAPGQALACASCPPTGAPAFSDISLPRDGLGLADDGRVFFTSSEAFVLRDTNERKDAYEWKDGVVQLISSGTSPADSGLLTVSADGVDAYFFTRETLSPEDKNGSPMKIYDARENGGFFYLAPPFPCAASDECHGPGTQAAPPPDINTVEGSGRVGTPPTAPKPCKKRFVKKHGKCVRKKPKNRRGRLAGPGVKP